MYDSISLLMEQFSKLDEDLAIQVVFSGLSLDPHRVFQKLSLANHLQIYRSVEKSQREEDIAAVAKIDALRDALAKTYFDKDNANN